MARWLWFAAVPVVLVAIAAYLLPKNILVAHSSDHQLSNFEIQTGLAAFCLSPVPHQLVAKERDPTGGNFNFTEDGDIENEEYTKGSIYALLYSMYAAVGTVLSETGVPYQFTFNTWGIAPSIFPESDPQRHGKTAYARLVDFPAVTEYLSTLNGRIPNIIEIGCGTGAGAHLISNRMKCNYTAIDMQKAAINTCNEIHAPNAPSLHCVHVPGGVGEKSPLPVGDNSQDIVVISETHIADIEIGPEEKAIFAEIHRVLRPGGLFVWGNALPTRVWEDALAYLPTAKFEQCGFRNHTAGAVQARDEDAGRVDAYCNQLFDKYYAFSIPYVGAVCRQVSDRLLKNFYRHPGTALYIRMVTGYDSYLHVCHRAVKPVAGSDD